MNVHCDPHNDSVLLYDEASGCLRQLEEGVYIILMHGFH